MKFPLNYLQISKQRNKKLHLLCTTPQVSLSKTEQLICFFNPKLHVKHRNVQLVIPADELVLTGEWVNH